MKGRSKQTMNKHRKLFCEISPLCYEISVFKCCMVRRLRDLFSRERFCRKGPEKLVPGHPAGISFFEYCALIIVDKIRIFNPAGISFFEYCALVKIFDERGCEIQLPVVIYKHKSLIRRQLGDVDMTLQNNKAVNLSLAAPKISGVLIQPGETFSLWHLVGKTSARKGYKEGLMIKRGKPDRGIGGGLCQLSNLIHWIVLHTPFEITEHHHHDGVDLFPDFGRQVPFGVGTSISYNYLDYRFKNNTEQTFQLIVYTDEKYLNAELRAEIPLAVKYHIESRNEHFTQENGIWYRNGEVWRQCIDKASGKIIEEKLIKTNHAQVMYDEKYINKGI